MLDSGLAPIEIPPPRVVAQALLPRRVCARRAARLGLAQRTALASPRDPNDEQRGASFLAELAARDEIELHLGERDRYAFVYAKGFEQVAGLLALAGASETVLALAEHSVIRRGAGGRQQARQRRAGEPRPRQPGRSGPARGSAPAAAPGRARAPLSGPTRGRRAAAAQPSSLGRRAGTHSGLSKPTLHGRFRRLQELAGR